MPDLAYNVYTNAPGEGPFVIFPTHAHQILSNCINIFCVSILSFCFARRTESENFGTRQWWAGLTWARLLVVLLFLDSWIFLAFSGILVNGVGLSLSVPVCSLGIYACIIFYAGSKALIYLFLVERVWIVWSAGNTLTRFQSRIYKVCALVVLGFLVIFVDMIIGRIAQIRPDGVCIIGLRGFATIPLLSYDLFVNVFLTSMFLWALYREQNVSQRLRRLARRTFLAALAALTTSSVNIIILATLDGKQLGWVCLGSCAADVTVNALVLFWVTAGGHRESNQRHTVTLPTLHVPVSFVREPGQRTETDPGQLAHASLKDLDDAMAAKSLSLKSSDIQFCSSPYPHRHRFSCEYDTHTHHYSNTPSPTSPASAKGGVFFSSSIHNRDVEHGGEFVEEDEWDIVDSSAGHNSLKDESDAEVWRMPTLNNNSHLHPSSTVVDLEPESPAYTLATDAMHGSYTRLMSSHSHANSSRNRSSPHSSMTRVNPPPLSIPAPVITKDVSVTPSSGLTSASALLPPVRRSTPSPPAIASTPSQALPSPPRKQSRKKLQRPQRPRSASSPPSTAMSRETAFSGETGESATLVCHSTCAAGYTYRRDPYYPNEEEYERWKKGEGSSTGARRFLGQPGMRIPRRTNTLPIPRSDDRHPNYPYYPNGHRHSSSSHGTSSSSSNTRSRSRNSIWRSFGAALGLGLGRTRSWALGAEDFQVGGFEGHGRDGFNAALVRSGSGLGEAAGSRVEVTVTTRTTVDIVDVRRVEEEREREAKEREEKMREREEEEVRRRALRRTRSDLGGRSPTSPTVPKAFSNSIPASVPSSMRLSSSSSQRLPAQRCFVVGKDEAHIQERQIEKRLLSLPPPPENYHLSGCQGVDCSRYGVDTDSNEGHTHSKPDCAAETETTKNNCNAIPTSSSPRSIPSPPPPLIPLRLSLSLQPERPGLPHLIIEPSTRTSQSTSGNSVSTSRLPP